MTIAQRQPRRRSAAPRGLLGMILLLSATVAAAAEDEDVVDAARAAGLRAFESAARSADLVELLKGDGPFTVFAPTDEAFAALPDGAPAERPKPEDKEKSRALLSRHVVAGRLTAADLAKLDGKSLTPLKGPALKVRVEDGTVRVGGAAVVKADVAASNGIVHVVDAVLLPPAEAAAGEVPPKPADGDAPLARGFPDATKPGVVEVKRYPAYRGAIARAKGSGVMAGNMLFFSLFNHIQRNRIEMTAPVINTYATPRMIETPGATGDVAMEFVYREPDEGKAGPDGATVEVVDHPPRDYVCLGYQGGDMNDARMREGLETLRRWLDEHKDEWIEDGPPRRLGYHGPMTRPAERLWELQIPVKPAR